MMRKQNNIAVISRMTRQTNTGFFKGKSPGSCRSTFYGKRCPAVPEGVGKPGGMKANATNNKQGCKKPFIHYDEYTQKTRNGQQ